MAMMTHLYKHYDANDCLLYVGISISALSRTAAHASISEWWNMVCTISIERYPTRMDALIAEQKYIKEESPKYNIQKRDYSRCQNPIKPAHKNAPNAVKSLHKWMDIEGRKRTWIADEIGVSRSTFRGWMTGRHTPMPVVRKAIESLTDGAVKYGDWDE